MNRGKKILLSIIGVLLLITSIVGVSYAYFTSMIAGNNDASSTVVTTGTMKIEYENSAEITGEKLLPGWQSETKTFTVKNTGTLPVSYSIKMTDVMNTFKDTINNLEGKPEELVFTLKRDGKTILSLQQFPTEDNFILSKAEIEPNTTHVYNIFVRFKELKKAQDYNQGREFHGKIEVAEIEIAKAILMEKDISNANAPELNNGMIPVTWNGRKWVKADTTKAWYNYDNQAWANAVTVTASSRNKYTSAEENTPIEMNDIETMWVWIPRYEYQYTNLSTQYAGGTKEIPGAITINFISKDTTTASDPDNYAIHDAFWWDDNNDGVKDANEQLSGIWIAKFEMSTRGGEYDSNVLEYPIVKPNMASWTGAQIGTFWTAIHQNMNGENNSYGLTNTDVHLMKNMEWGAVAYLSQSKYGKYGNPTYEDTKKEIVINNLDGLMSGFSGNDISSKPTTEQYDAFNLVHAYDTVKGTGASTTGNIYGIYDMSGGAAEYVMGVMKASGSNEPSIGQTLSYNSGWSGKFNSGTEFIGAYGQLKDIGIKYYDLYDYASDSADYTRYHKGDATYETASWYSDTSMFVNTSGSFFLRGGYYSNGIKAGVMNFNKGKGSADYFYGGRPALVPLN